jgi:hypothetical protein
MPTRDVRQVRSLHTIHSVGTAETYGTTNSPLSLRRAYRQEEQTRLPSQGRDPAPRIAHSVPSDITPSESADADLGAGYGSFGQSSSVWNQGHNVNEHGEIDVLEEEPPTAASQWRVLSAYPQSDTGSGRGTGRSLRDLAQRTDWRLTLGQVRSSETIFECFIKIFFSLSLCSTPKRSHYDIHSLVTFRLKIPVNQGHEDPVVAQIKLMPVIPGTSTPFAHRK